MENARSPPISRPSVLSTFPTPICFLRLSVLSLAAPLANIDAVQLPVQMHKVKLPVGGKRTRPAPIDFTGG